MWTRGDLKTEDIKKGMHIWECAYGKCEELLVLSDAVKEGDTWKWKCCSRLTGVVSEHTCVEGASAYCGAYYTKNPYYAGPTSMDIAKELISKLIEIACPTDPEEVTLIDRAKLFIQNA